MPPAALIYGRLERDAESHEATQLLLDLDDPVLWLAMLEILIRWEVEYPPYIMRVIWKKAATYQFQHNQGHAPDCAETDTWPLSSRSPS